MKKIKPPKKEGGRKYINQNPQFSGDGTPSEQRHPAFSLQHLNGKYCLSNCDSKEKAEFASTLHKLGQLTWSQIKQAQKHGLGCEKIARTAIRGASIPKHLTEDTTLLAFRCIGKAPMVGYREGHVFHILWVDRDFTLYDHE